MPSGKTQSTPSVDRALSILELLAQSHHGLSLPEIRDRLRLPKSSTHALLVTLERRGYLRRNDRTGRYLFGLRLLSLANEALIGLEIRDAAAPILRELARKTGLTVHMAVLERDEAVLIEKAEPLGTPKLATWIGKRMGLHCTGVGKALLAFQPEAELDRFIRDKRLPRHNENAIAGARRLRHELAAIRDKGHAFEDEEDEIGYRCVGVPVLDAAGTPRAALSLAGTTTQITRDREAPLAALLKKAATQIAASPNFN